jgi:ketosteroid isomerase-like protein
MGQSSTSAKGAVVFYRGCLLVAAGFLMAHISASVGLAHAHGPLNADSVAARKGIEREWVRIIDQLKRGDWPGVVAGWTPNGVYVHADYPDLVGYPEIQRLFDKEVGPKSRLVTLTRDVTHFIVEGDLALEGASSVEEWRTIGTPGKTHEPLRYLYVWKRQPDGRWRILYLIETTAPTKRIGG